MRFRSVVESNMIGIGFWDVNGEVTDANDALLEMIGYTREDLVSGQIRWIEFTAPEYRRNRSHRRRASRSRRKLPAL